MRHKIVLLIPIILIIKACTSFEWTHSNLYLYGNNIGMSLHIVNDTSFFLVTYRDSIEIFKSEDDGKNWNKLYSFEKKWFYESALMDDNNVYIAMKKKKDSLHAISKCSLYQDNIKTLLLPDSAYCEYGARLWMGSDNNLRLVLCLTGKKNRALYRISEDFNSLIFERSLPDSIKAWNIYEINDFVLVYQTRNGKNIVINYPDREEVLSSLWNKTPCGVYDGKIYLTAHLDTTDYNIYSYSINDNTIDTIPSFSLPKIVSYVKEDTLLTTMLIEKNNKVIGITTDFGRQKKIIDINTVGIYCTCIYKGRLYVYNSGKIKSYGL